MDGRERARRAEEGQREAIARINGFLEAGQLLALGLSAAAAAEVLRLVAEAEVVATIELSADSAGPRGRGD